MISSSNFVVIAWLVILARKDPGTSPLHTILFSRDKDPFNGINKLDVEDTTPESFYSEARETTILEQCAILFCHSIEILKKHTHMQRNLD